MRNPIGRHAAVLAVSAACWACGGQPSQPPAPPAAAPQPPAGAPDDPDPADDAGPVPTARTAEVLAKLVASNATGCAPGTRCIKTTANGKPLASGTSIAQCRGEFPDFIVPANTIPAGYTGPHFQPNKIEEAHTGVPSGTRPWRNFDPRQESQRLAYLLALRNYAFASAPVRALTPTLTADTDYFDATGGTVPAGQRPQKWYPAPRMMFGNPAIPGSGAREAAFGMTAERSTDPKTLADNINGFRNYAVAYYDARGARTFARVWSTATPGTDTADRTKMKFAAGGFVYKLLFSAAKPADFPTDILQNSLSVNIIPNGSGGPVAVRLLQIDIAVKDERAGTTGWYFATYALRSVDHRQLTVAENGPGRVDVGQRSRRATPHGDVDQPGRARVREEPSGLRGASQRSRRQPGLRLHVVSRDGTSAAPGLYARGSVVRIEAPAVVPQPLRDDTVWTLRSQYAHVRRGSEW